MPRSKTRQTRTPASFTGAPARWWLNLAVPVLPVLACFLGGATQKWSEGIVVALFWSLILGIIIALIGLIAFGGFVRGKWY